MQQENSALSLPIPGIWDIDPVHSAVGFSITRLMITTIRGQFTEFEGTIEIGEDPKAAKVQVSLQTAGIHTNNKDRDNHLCSPDFLDAEHFPIITFVSTACIPTKEHSLHIEGDLTIRGITKSVALATDFRGTIVDPSGNTRVGFSAHTEINREDFGISFNQPLEAGGVLLGKTVQIQLEIESILQSENQAAAK